MEENKNTVTQSVSEDYYVADMQVRMAHKVTGRTYWAFLATIVAVVITIIVLFNHYLSYEELMFKKMNIYLREVIGATDSDSIKNSDSIIKDTLFFTPISEKELLNWLEKNEIKDFDTLKFGNGNPISQQIREHYIRNHIDSMYIIIPLFGIKISVNDILILMGLTFLVLAIWLFFCIRSENFTIGKIISLNQHKEINVRSYIFYGICFNNLFFPTTQRLKPYKNLHESSHTLVEELEKIPTIKRKKRRAVHKHAIFFIPTIIMIITLSLDRYDIKRKIFDEKDYTMVEYKNEKYFIDDAKTARFDFHDYNIATEDNDPFKKHLNIILIISSILTICIFLMALQTCKYQIGTNHILYLFKQRFKHDEDCQKNMKFHEHKLENKTKEIHVTDIDSRVVFTQRNCYKKYTDRFAADYDIANNYYLLTNTGSINEAKRIVKRQISILNIEKYEGIHYEFDYKACANNENFNCKKNPYTFDLKICADKERSNKEYFIFIKISE